MKIVATMICWNAEPYVKYAIEGILPHVDHLILVYGAQQEYQWQVPDNTLNLCTEAVYSREDGKVILLIGKFDTEADQRNCYLEFIRKELDCDWLWVVDADEFYKPIHVKLLKVLAEEILNRYDCKPIQHILYPFYNFYGYIPEGFHYYKINNGGMLKFIRWREDLQYHYEPDRPQVLDNIGDSKHHTLWETRMGYQLPIECYHYGHVATPEQYLLKLLGSCLRDSTNPQKTHLSKLGTTEQTNWIHGNYPWFHEDWIEQLGLTRFTGIHPESVQRMMEDYGWR